jgi:hypothetical protein
MLIAVVNFALKSRTSFGYTVNWIVVDIPEFRMHYKKTMYIPQLFIFLGTKEYNITIDVGGQNPWKFGDRRRYGSYVHRLTDEHTHQGLHGATSYVRG